MTKSKAFFITGTDTEVGKTFTSVTLLKLANNQGLKTLGLKPVAAGCQWQDGQWVNEDALAIQQASTIKLPYKAVNPCALEPAIAPHIAAEQSNVRLSALDLAEACRATLATDHDFAVVEGAGGWRVPLNDGETLADLAKALKLPVVLVVGMRLGCINHALLTAAAIRADGLLLAGWVANQIDQGMPVAQDNINTLRQSLDCTFLGHIPFLSNDTGIDMPKLLDIDKLLGS